jgi:hypothetical protein
MGQSLFFVIFEYIFHIFDIFWPLGYAAAAAAAENSPDIAKSLNLAWI